MRPPAEFVELARSFLPGSRTKDITLEGQIAGVITWMKPWQRAACKQYLTDLLASQAGDYDLKQIWDSTNPTYGFPRGIRYFPTLLRDAL